MSNQIRTWEVWMGGRRARHLGDYHGTWQYACERAIAWLDLPPHYLEVDERGPGRHVVMGFELFNNREDAERAD